jgi:hypothetical protein
MKALKIILVVAAVFSTLVVTAFLLMNESEPEGKAGAQADRLAGQMLEALNVAAWDSTRYLQWTFVNNNRYLWDKGTNKVVVVSGSDSVILDATTVTGRAFGSNGAALSGAELDESVAVAWRNFCNDGFWLYAPFKVFDPGTVRSIVTLEDGSEALKVTYMEGGVTPGDSYLWILDADHRPKAWKMWVNILPVGGMEFTWDDWQQLPSGAWLSTMHASPVFDIAIRDVRSAQVLSELGVDADPFTD